MEKNRIIKEIQFFDPQLIDTELDNKEITLSRICKRNLKPIACKDEAYFSEINISNIGALEL